MKKKLTKRECEIIRLFLSLPRDAKPIPIMAQFYNVSIIEASRMLWDTLQKARRA